MLEEAEGVLTDIETDNGKRVYLDLSRFGGLNKKVLFFNVISI